MLRQRKSPVRSQRKVVRRSVALLKESSQLGCVFQSSQLGRVSQDSYPRKSFLRESGTFGGSKHAVKFSKFGKERVHREALSKSVHLMSVVLARQNPKKDHMKRPCTKKDATAEQHGICRKMFTSSRIRTKLRLILMYALAKLHLGHVWPEVLLRIEKNTNGQKRSRSSTMLEYWEGFTLSIPMTTEYKETLKNARRKLEIPMAPDMPCRRAPNSITKVFAQSESKSFLPATHHTSCLFARRPRFFVA